jgi:hypothetical protein
MKIETDKRPASFALGSFHHAISEGDHRKVKDYVQGISSIPGTPGIRISCNEQDQVLKFPEASINVRTSNSIILTNFTQSLYWSRTDFLLFTGPR